jgi:hypothetical protein
VIGRVLAQQNEMFTNGTHSVPDRTISIAKSYRHPIIRGKDVKKVEFGAKVNMIRVDEINFIIYLSIDAFTEGQRLIDSIWYSRTLFGKLLIYQSMKSTPPMLIENSVQNKYRSKHQMEVPCWYP